MKVELLRHVQLLVIPWGVAPQVPPSVGFSKQEYWGGLPFLSPGCLPDPGIEVGSPALQANSLLSEPALITAIGFVVTFVKGVSVLAAMETN